MVRVFLLSMLISSMLALFGERILADTTGITVVNRGQESIVELYVINQSAQTWGDDLLQGQAVQANQQRSISISVNCPCRIKAIYDDGAVRYQQTSTGGTVVFNH